MTLEQEPFRKYKIDEENKKIDSFTVRLNKDERLLFEQCKKTIEQTKDSTALKQLAWIGSIVIHDKETQEVLGLIFKNKRNNKRMGIVEFE